MIHSARSTVSPVVIIVFYRNLFVLLDFKSADNFAKTLITSAEWIKKIKHCTV